MSRYSTQVKSSSPSVAIEESKKKSTLLKDNSWIRKPEEEDEPVDRDPNFGRSVLGRYKPNETTASSEQEDVKTTKPVKTSSSVLALTKRFSSPQDTQTSPTSTTKSTSTYTKRYSSVKPEATSSTSPVKEETKTSTKTSTVTKDDGSTKTTTTTTTISSTQSVKSPVTKSPPKTDTFSERVKSSSKGAQYSPYSPTKTTVVAEKPVSSTKEAEDKLYDTLIPSSVRSDPPATDSKTTLTSTRTVTVKSTTDGKPEDELYDTLLPKSITSGSSSPVKSSVTKTSVVTVESSQENKDAEDKLYDSLLPKAIRGDVTDSKTTVESTKTDTEDSIPNGGYTKTTITKKISTSSTPEDDLYNTLLPKSITSDSSSPVRSSVTKKDSINGGESPTLTSPSFSRTNSDTYSRSYSYSKPDSSYEYTSITSPSTYTSTSFKRSDDPLYSKTSRTSVYGSSERPVLEKDLCTHCRKPFTGDAKMVLDDMKINCHATCFKCDVCNCSLGHMKAGDNMWIYKRMIHCENCFESTRVKWRC
ncbi:Sciellin [Oryzias melastigma]|uniref:Sciellin n=1 Tax=Oryzias melastigma TaxID=30732 RepID=A0A834C1G2_ORYME|nr:Sciellin [Oryzias melastigma]